LTTLLERGVAMLGTKMPLVAGRTIVFKRGSHSSSAITAWVASVEYDITDKNGVTVSMMRDNWTMLATDVVIGGAQITPRDGDRITETLNGVAIEYEVVPVGTRKSCEFLDTSGNLLLVHTKKVA
jgi:hypothetical protein